MNDLSNLIAGLQVSLERLTYLQMRDRLAAYTERVGEREGMVFRDWKQLPKNHLETLLAKVNGELDAYVVSGSSGCDRKSKG